MRYTDIFLGQATPMEILNYCIIKSTFPTVLQCQAGTLQGHANKLLVYPSLKINFLWTL